MATRISLIIGHRYGPSLVRGLLASPELKNGNLLIGKVLCIHPYISALTGGYDDASGILAENELRFSYFRDVNAKEVTDELKENHPRFILVCGLRQIIPKTVLNIPKHATGGSQLYSNGYGCIGFHPSLLPSGAGMSPIQHTIMEGAESLGMSSFMIVQDQWDAGPIILQDQASFQADLDATELHGIANGLIEKMAKDVASRLALHSLDFTPQDRFKLPRTFRKSLLTADRWIDPHQDVDLIERQVRAFSPPYQCAFLRTSDTTITVRKSIVIERSKQDVKPTDIGKIEVGHDHILLHCKNGKLRIDDFTTHGKDLNKFDIFYAIVAKNEL